MNASHRWNYKIIPVASDIGLRFLLVFLSAHALLFTAAGFAEPNQLNAELLQPQRELVETLRTRSEEMQMEDRVGQADIQDIIYAAEAYFRELEVLQVMEARISNKRVSEKVLLKIRAEVRTKALSYFEDFYSGTQARLDLGEIKKSDFTATKAAMLNARIKLETLKSAGGS
jgi:hypothetical protein